MSTLRYEKNGEIVTRRIAGESILVPVASNVANLDAVYTMGEVGDFIWQRIDGATAVDEIVDALCAEYAVERDEAATDVAKFIASLEEADLVRPVETAGNDGDAD